MKEENETQRGRGLYKMKVGLGGIVCFCHRYPGCALLSRFGCVCSTESSRWLEKGVLV